MIIVGSSQRFAASDPNVRFFNDSKAMAVSDQKSTSLKSSKKIATTTELFFIYTFQSFYCDEMLSNLELMKEVGRADLIIGELLYLCSSLVVAKFSLPHVVISAATLSTPTAFALGLPFSPSYVPQWGIQLPDEWSIFDRAKNLWHWMSLYVLFARHFCSLFDKVKTKHGITPDRSIQETLGRVDMIIGQMHFGLEHPRPLYPSKYVVCKEYSMVKTGEELKLWTLEREGTRRYCEGDVHKRLLQL